MGRASAIASWPPCSSPRGSAAPMENSPPGIHTMPAGVGPGAAGTAATVAANAGAGAGSAAARGAAAAGARSRAFQPITPAMSNTAAPASHARPGPTLASQAPTMRQNGAALLWYQGPMERRPPPCYTCDRSNPASTRRLLMRSVLTVMLGAAVLVTPAWAQSTSGTWNDLPDRFTIDTGYFHLDSTAVLTLQGGRQEVDFERDLGLDTGSDTFWTDATWRVGRRHQLKLGFTRINREGRDHVLTRDFVWGGQTYNAGLVANGTTGSDILGGYYRFALFRNDRFEIGPTVGIGYLWLDAGIRAEGTITRPGGGTESRSLERTASTGSITGAVGGYTNAWATKRLEFVGDFLYIKATLGDTEVSVTDWRAGANYYILRNAGLGVQYKYNKFSEERDILSSELGGELTFKGFQVYLSFRF